MKVNRNAIVICEIRYGAYMIIVRMGVENSQGNPAILVDYRNNILSLAARINNQHFIGIIVQNVASLPSLEEARAKIIGILQSPAQKIASILLAPAQKIAILSLEKSKKN